ncbi:MAG: hypothetical protein A3C80_00875 [Candidatus Ryanbacteria bacterium RIFCSPHIGHO2_02_FULL_45_43]|nr:MAG: hypothetical protein A2718_03985 [Candidatus Ryanbacteria bacterium RIFCSPHIGHO2_01_FULL_44_130]OGZ48932.1 MAG: hypothetical protein A3C80_00875 [Candidatus Ryanbacteria bacterium RIFCSPHIGHO2_02_FULL_45_43]OGZ51748.1 MAG: hypothetical protein A3A17_00060 [Candidatus Ryanbacteria bacterium RIFCSPLOWO2_01_FULL_44_230]OGZ53446.1 MAG: hypothetical protein A3H62_03580 [Candidatus Ryanbacteria bacterium RIFCSPLOWO2_02_FULL_44_40]OGZ54887.1 MAG: hypothetical protein A3F85_04350 [Candidatus Ry
MSPCAWTATGTSKLEPESVIAVAALKKIERNDLPAFLTLLLIMLLLIFNAGNFLNKLGSYNDIGTRLFLILRNILDQMNFKNNVPIE